MKKECKFLFLAIVLVLFMPLIAASSGSLQVTTEHPFLIKGKWVPASQLKPGDTFTTLSGKTAVIRKIEDVTLKDPFPVYNLEAGVYHDFVVGPFDIVVHNSNKDLPDTYLESAFSSFADNFNDDPNFVKRLIKAFRDGKFYTEKARLTRQQIIDMGNEGYLQLYDKIRLQHPEFLGPNGELYLGISSDSSQILLGVPTQGYEVNGVLPVNGLLPNEHWTFYDLNGFGVRTGPIEIILNPESNADLMAMLENYNVNGNANTRNVFTIRANIIKFNPSGDVEILFLDRAAKADWENRILRLPYTGDDPVLPSGGQFEVIKAGLKNMWPEENNAILYARAIYTKPLTGRWKIDPASLQKLRSKMQGLSSEQQNYLFRRLVCRSSQEAAISTFKDFGLQIPVTDQ